MVTHAMRIYRHMNSVYYLDSNICIFHMRRPFGILADRINAMPPDRIKIPAVVKGELLVSAEKSKRRNETLTETLAFLMPYEIVPFDDSMLMTYAKMRAALELRGQKIGYNDTIIAATVLARKGILVTNNISKFGRIDGLNHEDWTLPR